VGTSGLQCGVDVLRQYRVLGVAGSPLHSRQKVFLGGTSSGVLIAQLPQSKHTVAIKVGTFYLPIKQWDSIHL